MVRECLICSAPISHMHMSIDACRACAVFYRRARRSKTKFRCKKNTGKCVESGSVLECRRCRYDEMSAILAKANREIPQLASPSSSSLTPPRSAPAKQEAADAVDDAASRQYEPLPSSSLLCSSPIATSALYNPLYGGGPSTSATPTTTPALNRIRCAYDVMTRIRKAAELGCRPLHLFVHPTAICDDSFPLIPGTHAQAQRYSHSLLTALLDFASIAFPDFDSFTTQQKWYLVNGCFERIHIVESTFRSNKHFQDSQTIFVTFTTTLSVATVDHFLSDCDTACDKAIAKKLITRNLKANVERTKGMMKRIAPCDEEFLVMIALSFWNTDIPSCDDVLHRVALANRAAVMKDLHAFYFSRGLTDYATRIGELFCLLVASHRTAMQLTEDVEVLRLMEIYQHPRL